MIIHFIAEENILTIIAYMLLSKSDVIIDDRQMIKMSKKGEYV